MDLPHTPLRRYDQPIPVSPVVLDIERRLPFTPEHPASLTSTRLNPLSPTAYSPRPDDFYFDDGAGGYVTKLELPDNEKDCVLVADEYLSDIRKLEEAIEVSNLLGETPWSQTCLHICQIRTCSIYRSRQQTTQKIL